MGAGNLKLGQTLFSMRVLVEDLGPNMLYKHVFLGLKKDLFSIKMKELKRQGMNHNDPYNKQHSNL